MKKKSVLMLSGLIFAGIWLFSGCQAPVEQKEDMDMKEEKALKVAILVGEGFHDGEAYMPMGFLTNQGVKVSVIGPEQGEVTAYNSAFTILIDKAITEVSVEDFDALILPGGQAPAKLRENEDVVAFARDFFNSGKPTAAICHGPQVLITAGVMEGKATTGVSGIIEEFEEAGANYLDQSVVVDGNLITSRVPRDLHDFVSAIMAALN